ncbi:MAG: DUF6447 family protein [Desulfuromonadaceae bacterium]|nr:DUF6447 family protein [Desulfuromonadaceae bacterium]
MLEAGKIIIDGVEYSLAALSEAAQTQIQNLQLVDAQIVHLQQQLAIAQTARAAYASVLQIELPKAEAA